MTEKDDKSLSAFVVMPFETEFDEIYTDLIVPALESEGFTAMRADSTLDQQNVLKDIVQGIAFSDLVIADLTSMNPNVLYELGLAHALRKPTILLTQSIEAVPFDLRSYRMIVYSTHYAKASALKNRLRDIARRLAEGRVEFGNPITDFAPSTTVGHVVGSELAPPQPEQEHPVGVDEAEPGWLDFADDGMASMERITAHMTEVSEITRELTENMQSRTAELELLQKRPGRSVTGRVRKLASVTAIDMTRYAQTLEAGLPEFHEMWESYLENGVGLFTTVRIDSPDEREAVEDLLPQMEKLRTALGVAHAGTSEMRQVLLAMKGVSQDINRAVEVTGRAMDGFLEELTIGESYVARTIEVLEERLNAGRTSE